MPDLIDSQADPSNPDSIWQLSAAWDANCSHSRFAISASAIQLARSASYLAFWRFRAASHKGSIASLTQRLFSGLRNWQDAHSRVSLSRLHCVRTVVHTGAGGQSRCSQMTFSTSKACSSAENCNADRAELSKSASMFRSASEACKTSRKNDRRTSTRAMVGLSPVIEKSAVLRSNLSLKVANVCLAVEGSAEVIIVSVSGARMVFECNMHPDSFSTTSTSSRWASLLV